MERLDVTILGRDISLACPADEKTKLLESVKYADQLMLKIKGSSPSMVSASNERIAVMACIQIASELLSLKAPDSGFSGTTYGEFKNKIEYLTSLLDDSITEVKKVS